jgi:L-alanine-DL-glutamate epimerase-like enolase superfamily enzyme
VHFAAISPSTPCFEFVAAEAYSSPLRRAIREIGLPVMNGAIALPTRPGIGIELTADIIKHYRVA